MLGSLRLDCKVRRKKHCNSYQGGQGIVAPNLLNRPLDAGSPNEKRVTEVTEFSAAGRP